MMHWYCSSVEIALTRDSEIPVGVQLAWALRARILGGELTAGERLPGVRELAAATGVNINTVRSVYTRLEGDGLIHAEHGRGTFVSPTAAVDERLAALTRRALDEAQSAGPDPREVAAALFGGLSGGSGPSAARTPAARRRALREEIAGLERELAAEQLARSVQTGTSAPARGTGPHLPDEDELRAQRDALAVRLAALRTGEQPVPEPRPVSRSATRPGYVLRPSFG